MQRKHFAVGAVTAAVAGIGTAVAVSLGGPPSAEPPASTPAGQVVPLQDRTATSVPVATTAPVAGMTSQAAVVPLPKKSPAKVVSADTAGVSDETQTAVDEQPVDENGVPVRTPERGPRPSPPPPVAPQPDPATPLP